MKKLKFLLSLSILFFALYSCNEQLEVQGLESQETIDSKKSVTKPFETLPIGTDIDYCGEPIKCTLIAGQHIDSGTVTVRNDATYLYVEVYSKAGFQNVEENIKMWIGKELPSKRPPAGHFPYKVTESGNTHTFKIELSSLDAWDAECGENTTPFYIIVHADVLTESGSSETAFGGCEEGSGKGAWWYYMEYKVSCCNEEEEEEEEDYAFMYKGKDHATCYDDEGVIGWSNKHHYRYYRTYTRTNNIYFNSDNNCDILSDSDIGDVTFSMINPYDEDINPTTNNEEMNFHFEMDTGAENYEYKIYAGWENPLDANGELKAGITFGTTTPGVLSFDYTTLVSTWGDYPAVDGNTRFYVIIKVKMI